jgi:hypothetical protein
LPLRGQLNARQSYREEVWILMHGGSAKYQQETASVRLWLDESGGEDPGTPYASLGALLINHGRFESFETAWEELLERYNLTPPLHMKEFGRPDGRFGYLTNECRYQIFSEVVEIINSHKLYSFAANISNAQYESAFNKKLRDIFGVYGMCYLMLVWMNHSMAERNKYPKTIPFIFDIGNSKADHIVKSHAEIQRWQRETYFHMGGLHFEKDECFALLQAADVVAWGARRRATKLSMNHGFSPILRIFEPSYHIEADWKSEWMVGLNETLMQQYRRLEVAKDEERNRIREF